MIGRIHERREFERVNRHGRRARTESLWCRYLGDPAAVPPRVAFAIGRNVGSAVTRNRLRRRLRALVTTMSPSDSGPGLLPYGWLLIGAHPGAAERTFDELGAQLTSLMSSVRRRQVVSS